MRAAGDTPGDVRATRLPLRVLLLTVAAMLAFAGNSLLCRLALASGSIDPASFTAIRLAAGAGMLLAILAARGLRPALRVHADIPAALMLFAYAASFSFAYVSLDAATGALLLFGFVQLTMIAWALARGERPPVPVWAGWCAAVAGLAWLLLPGAGAPAPLGAALMACSGVAWGIYSIRGQRAGAALPATAANFLLTLPLLLLLPLAGDLQLSTTGILLAALSGAVTSGLGYVLWYAALARLQSMQAALVQLSVPALAAAGGVMLLGEALSVRLVAAGALVLGGIFVALRGRAAAA